ncbi:MAG: hypothetical protein WDO15_00785 [Bacteroidota bacterium]
MTGLVIASAVGGIDVKGIMIAPAWFRVGDKHKNDDGTTEVKEGTMTGLSVSAYNSIKGEQRGVCDRNCKLCNESERDSVWVNQYC